MERKRSDGHLRSVSFKGNVCFWDMLIDQQTRPKSESKQASRKVMDNNLLMLEELQTHEKKEDGATAKCQCPEL